MQETSRFAPNNVRRLHDRLRTLMSNNEPRTGVDGDDDFLQRLRFILNDPYDDIDLEYLGDMGRNELSHLFTTAPVKIRNLELLIAFSLANTGRKNLFNMQFVEQVFDELLQLHEGDEQIIDLIYEALTRQIPQSQLSKIMKRTEIELDQKLLVCKTLIKIFFTPVSRPYQEDIEIESYLALDRPTQEALCWWELEKKKTDNADLARISGAIAWRLWLHKTPLAQRYCRDHQDGVVYKDLSFSARAQMTQEALKRYSDDEAATIIDEAVETEIEHRLSGFREETRPEYRGKKVSLGIELEMYDAPLELGVLYAWYENLDREAMGGEFPFKEEIDELFTIYSSIRNGRENLKQFRRISTNLKRVILRLEQDGEENQETEYDPGTLHYFDVSVRQAVLSIPDKNNEIKTILTSWINTEGANLLEIKVLKVLKDHWATIVLSAQQKLSTDEAKFLDTIVRSEGAHETGDNDYYGETWNAQRHDARSGLFKKIIDAYAIFMSENQVFGHGRGGDGYGEHALHHVSGDFNDPYRLYLRQVWELAKLGLHDLDTDQRPMHITIGFNRELEKMAYDGDDELEKDKMREASLLGFALMATGWGNHALIAQIQATGKKIVSFDSRGRTDLLRSRYSEKGSGVEFRCFEPNNRDMAKLIPLLGWLGSAMAAYLQTLLTDNEDEFGQPLDPITIQLATIWIDFRQKLKQLYESQHNTQLPPLSDLNTWWRYYNTDKVANFFQLLADDFGQPNGFVVDMRHLVLSTQKEIEAVFDDTRTHEKDEGEITDIASTELNPAPSSNLPSIIAQALLGTE